MPSKKRPARKSAPGAAHKVSSKAASGTQEEKPPRSASRAKSSKATAPGADSPLSDVQEPRELIELPTFTPKGLTPLQHRFTQEFLIDLNGTKAYQRASPDSSYETAASESCRLLAEPKIAQEVQRLMDERAVITGISTDRVLFRLWAMATADTRELSGHRIGACRHCYGQDHGYQRTAQELRRDTEKHIAAEIKREKAEKGDFVPRQFDEMGGIGYTPKRPPNPDCPECFGDGESRPYLADTDHLSEAGAMLFKGIKTTKDGVSLETQNPGEMIQLIGRHLGMWNDKIKVVDETNPLMALLNEIQAAHTTLPIVHDDPELKPAGQVQDVASRPAGTPAKHPAPGAGSPVKKPTKWRAV